MAAAPLRFRFARRVWVQVILALSLGVPLVQAQDFYWALALGGQETDNAEGITADDSGNIYTVGDFQGTADFDPGSGTFELSSAGGPDAVVIKLGPLATLEWAVRFGGMEIDRGEDVAVDAEGNVFVVGIFKGTGDFDPGPGTFELTSQAQFDPFVVKLDSGGNLIWAISFPGSGWDVARNVVVDDGGDVVVAGTFSGVTDFDPGPGVFRLASSGGSEMFLVRLDSQGNLLWAQQNEAGGVLEEGGLALDRQGAIFASGSFDGTPSGDFDPGPGIATLDGGCWDAYVLKLAATGEFQWVRGTHGHPCDGDIGFGTDAMEIALDAAGNSYVFGSFAYIVDFDPGPASFELATSDYFENAAFVWKLDPEGNFVWVRHIENLNDHGSNFATAGSVDACGRAYVAGDFGSTADFDPGPAFHFLSPEAATGFDPFIWKLDAMGNLLWAGTFDGGSETHSTGVATTTEGNFYVAGTFSGVGDFSPGPGTYGLASAGGQDQFVLAMTQSPATLTLQVSTSHLQWDGPACSGGYDIVRGDLSELVSSGGDFTLATTDCVVSMQVGQQFEIPAEPDPDPGQGVWFLVREAEGSYDSGGPSQLAPRDDPIDLSGVDCS